MSDKRILKSGQGQPSLTGAKPTKVVRTQFNESISKSGKSINTKQTNREFKKEGNK